MEMTNDLVLGQGLHVSPRLIQANYMLGLSSLELQQFIRQETYDNPALEVNEQVTCPTCGAVLIDVVCFACVTPRDETEPRPSDSSEAYDEPLWDRGMMGSREDEYDSLLRVAQGASLQDRLLVDLELQLDDPRDLPLVEYLVGSLDDNGWLRCTVAEVAATFQVAQERVEHVLALLQSQEPAGIGARDLRECLLIQLAYLEKQGQGHPRVREIVVHHFDALAGHRHRQLARALGISLEEATAACRFVRTYLNPFPAQQDATRPRTAPTDLPRYIVPDVIISIGSENELMVTTIESKRFTLRVSPQYQQIHREMERRGAAMGEKDRDHVRQYVSRARRFLANLEQRRQTMQKIGEFVAEYQEDFLRHGVRHLRPLTRAVVAAATGMHESTVSRATAGKHVLIPNGHVIPWSDFFTAALNAKDVIKSLIGSELTPLDDQQIALRLQDHGHFLARRTVAKYRDELGIPAAALRR